MNSGISHIAKQIIEAELLENVHMERVEDVIFWALEAYSKKEDNTTGRIIAASIVNRIKDAEKRYQEKQN